MDDVACSSLMLLALLLSLSRSGIVALVIAAGVTVIAMRRRLARWEGPAPPSSGRGVVLVTLLAVSLGRSAGASPIGWPGHGAGWRTACDLARDVTNGAGLLA